MLNVVWQALPQSHRGCNFTPTPPAPPPVSSHVTRDALKVCEWERKSDRGYMAQTSCRCGVVIAFVSNPNEINTDRPQLLPQSTRTATATSTSLFLLAFYLHSLRRIKLLCTNQIHKHKIPRHTHTHTGASTKTQQIHTHTHTQRPLWHRIATQNEA